MAYLTKEISDSLTDEHLELLQRADIWTVNDLCSRDLMDIKRATNIKFHILKELLERVKERYTAPCNDLNFLVSKSIDDLKMVPTGLPELTQALQGGFQTQEIVEFTGESECGKTEMCYLLCGEILSHFDKYNILYVASNHDFDHEKVIKYTIAKAGNRVLSEDDLFNALSRVDIARPTKLSDLVHLLRTLVHADRNKSIKCIIIDSLSFIIQEEILAIKTSNLDDADELEKFTALMGHLWHQDKEGLRREITDNYLHEVMRLLTNVALTMNVIIVITNSNPYLSYSKTWNNAIDHRIQLSKMPDFSRYKIDNPRATVCRATILKTIHNVHKVGYSVPFAITDECLFCLRQAPIPLEDEDDDEEEK